MKGDYEIEWKSNLPQVGIQNPEGASSIPTYTEVHIMHDTCSSTSAAMATSGGAG